ncbi:response regulator [bacterium]|nr:response regulator [bacterium]
MTIRILIADDHDLFRDGLVSVLRSQPDFEVVGEAGDGLEAFVMAQQLRPDIVLMDINMPGADGLAATQMIHQLMPDMQIVMLTMREEKERIFSAIRNGAQGYLLKTIRAADLFDMIRSAARGEAALTPEMAALVMNEFRRVTTHRPSSPPAHPPQETDSEPDPVDVLTQREQEILTFISQGLADKEIAHLLDISLYTVKAHVRSILSKLHVNNRREAAQVKKGLGTGDQGLGTE